MKRASTENKNVLQSKRLRFCRRSLAQIMMRHANSLKYGGAERFGTMTLVTQLGFLLVQWVRQTRITGGYTVRQSRSHDYRRT